MLSLARVFSFRFRGITSPPRSGLAAAWRGKEEREGRGDVNESIKGDLERKSRTDRPTRDWHFTCDGEKEIERDEREREEIERKKFKSCPELVRRVRVRFGIGMGGWSAEREGRKEGRRAMAIAHAPQSAVRTCSLAPSLLALLRFCIGKWRLRFGRMDGALTTPD